MSEADRSDLQYARDRWRRTREISQLHRRRLRNLGSVFGPAVRVAAEEHLEDLIESAEDVVDYYERVVEGLHAERSKLREEVVTFQTASALHRVDLAQARAEVDRLLATAVPAQGEGVEDAL